MKRNRAECLAVYVALTALTVIFLFPLVWILGLSLKTRLQVFASPPLFVWWPTFENYVATLSRANFGQAFINSLLVSAGAVSLSLIVGVPAAYALALFSFPSLAAYEQYRALFGTDPDFLDADRIRDESNCVLRYERTFMRPLLPGH